MYIIQPSWFSVSSSVGPLSMLNDFSMFFKHMGRPALFIKLMHQEFSFDDKMRCFLLRMNALSFEIKICSLVSLNWIADEIYYAVNEKLFFVTGLTFYLNATINPVIYNMMSAKYRKAFRSTFFGANSSNGR